MPLARAFDTLPLIRQANPCSSGRPERLVAAAQYSGRWSESTYRQHLAELASAVVAAGLASLGTARFARFDPPWKPWFLRRNEVLLDVSRQHP